MLLLALCKCGNTVYTDLVCLSKSPSPIPYSWNKEIWFDLIFQNNLIITLQAVINGLRQRIVIKVPGYLIVCKKKSGMGWETTCAVWFTVYMAMRRLNPQLRILPKPPHGDRPGFELDENAWERRSSSFLYNGNVVPVVFLSVYSNC